MIFLYISSIATWLLIIHLFIKPFISRFEVRIARTTWEKKPYGIYVMFWNYPHNKFHYTNSAKGIFHFNWRNPRKLSDDVKKCKSR